MLLKHILIFPHCSFSSQALAPHMQQGSLFTDVLSVKSGICDAYNSLKDKYPHVELLRY